MYQKRLYLANIYSHKQFIYIFVVYCKVQQPDLHFYVGVL